MICGECKHIPKGQPLAWDGTTICPKTGKAVNVNREIIGGCPHFSQRQGGRRPGAGGSRVGTGAPKGNFNALKHGRHSKQVKAGVWPPSRL